MWLVMMDDNAPNVREGILLKPKQKIVSLQTGLWLQNYVGRPIKKNS